MIVPMPVDVTQWKQFPLTFTLLVTNVLIYFLFFAAGAGTGYHRQEMLQPEQLELTGYLYSEWQGAHPEALLRTPEWVLALVPTQAGQRQVMGAYALRDAAFMETASSFDFSRGDQIQIENWKEKIKKYKDFYLEQSAFQYGINAWVLRPFSWLTYQFSHSNFIHLLSNMIFLVLVGTAVEALVGSAGFLVVYILGGVAGGLLFLIQNTHGLIPMIGASASISALMGFYAIAERRQRVRFFYMLMPIEKYFGAIYLPTLSIIPLFLVVDLASLISTPEGWGGGVAYSAHLGGAIWGLLTGFIYRFMRKN